MKIGFVSLGCSKNLIDTEMAIGLFKTNNFEIVNKIKNAEIILINTCGFIEPAKQESINTIIEMSKYKKIGKCRYLIVIGCLVQRYINDLQKELPEVDLFIKINDYKIFWEKFEEFLKNKKEIQQIQQKEQIKEIEKLEKNKINLLKKYNLDYMQRVVSTGKNTAYLKIAEGCNNRCTYCAIPYIRGEYISRPIEEILKEAEKLAKEGIKELIIIAQDTTKYGLDLYKKQRLPELLNKLSKIEKIEWIRLLYTYPESITDELINEVKTNEKICKYFDIPIQHISDYILKKMNRKSNSKQIEELINKLRKEIPNVILRTSLIVGFPGETNEDFDKLYKFVEKIKFDKLGVFEYSKEDGTPAAKLDKQIHYKIKQKRYNVLMKLAENISKEKLKKYIGEKYKVLIEKKARDNKYYTGRTYMDCPDTDGIVFIKNNINIKKNKNKIKDFVECKIIDTQNYDLIAEIVKK